MKTGRLGGDPHANSRPRENGGEVSSTLLDRDQTPPARVGDASDLVEEKDEGAKRVQRLIRRMRIQIWAGTISGFVIALSIGAAFIAVVSVVPARSDSG